MHDPSFVSTNTVATLARKIAYHGHPDVDIKLHQQSNEPTTYTSGDSLSGEVSIKAPHAARFDDVEITLLGLTLTHVENMTPVSTNARMDAKHPFLKLIMPIPESDYPQPRIAEAGQTYKFPFNFVIPQHLLSTVCKHACVGDHVHEAHLHLPPSMGDRDVSPLDDLSPDMAKTVYAIRVRVLRTRERDGKVTVLTDRSRKIRVIPAIPEAPPMHIPADEKEYTLSVTKQLRKGMFAGKLGKITVSASQTKALAVPSVSTSEVTTIMATLKLRFDPSETRSQPPRLGSLTSKIKSSTFYAVKPLNDLARRGGPMAAYDLTRGNYTTSTSLATRSVENVPWVYHHVPSSQSLRRDSGYSSCSSAASCSDSSFSSSSEATTTASTAGSWYETSILVPLTLPSSKTWLPTFHSCLASRIYSLDMSLSVHTPGTGVPSSTISLRLPVQISSGPPDGGGVLAGTLGEAAEQQEVEDYLRPRVISVPGVEFVMSSTLSTTARAGRLPSFAESESEGDVDSESEPLSPLEREREPLASSPTYTATVSSARRGQQQQRWPSHPLTTQIQSHHHQTRSQPLGGEAPPGYEMPTLYR